MTVDQAAQTKLDEFNRCNDLVWTTAEHPNQPGLANPVEFGSLPVESAASQSGFAGLIRAGQSVFLTGNQSIGSITSLLPGDAGDVSYLVIRKAGLWGHHKIVPVALVNEVNPSSVCLSIDRSKFQGLPEYKTDATIANEIDSALWNDEVLRFTDYHEVDVQVKNGVVVLSGHITGVMNRQRIENAVGSVTGILAVRVHLVADDALLLKVAEALVQIELVEGNQVFANVQNGLVVLNGHVISAKDRSSAEQCAANIPSVRGVINRLAAPGIDLDAEDQRFLQPTIGEEIYFRDGPHGTVNQVIINRNNRRVVAMILQGQFSDPQQKSASMTSNETPPPDQLAVVRVSVIQYLTSASGFLTIDSTEKTKYQDYDPANFIAPEAGWLPPYPYCTDNVRFIREL